MFAFVMWLTLNVKKKAIGNYPGLLNPSYCLGVYPSKSGESRSTTAFENMHFANPRKVRADKSATWQKTGDDNFNLKSRESQGKEPNPTHFSVDPDPFSVSIIHEKMVPCRAPRLVRHGQSELCALLLVEVRQPRFPSSDFRIRLIDSSMPRA